MNVLDDEELDEEALAMKAMGLPTSFTSSLVLNLLFNMSMYGWIFFSLRLNDQDMVNNDECDQNLMKKQQVL